MSTGIMIIPGNPQEVMPVWLREKERRGEAAGKKRTWIHREIEIKTSDSDSRYEAT